jgi:hypothetical protein
MNKQLTIFDIMNETKFDTISNKLSKYGIDEYYKEHLKGNGMLIMTIYNALSNLDNYEEYINQLYEELKKYIPVINKDDDYGTVGMYLQNDSIRICEPSQWYSIFCLEMINKEFLENGVIR